MAVDCTESDHKCAQNDDLHGMMVAHDMISETKISTAFYSCLKIALFKCCARSFWQYFSHTFSYFSGLFDLVQKYYKAELKFPEEAAKAALCACFYGLQWDLIYIQSTTERDSTVNDVNALKTRLDQYIVAMQEVLANSTGIILEEAYLCICDLLISFSRRVSFR